MRYEVVLYLSAVSLLFAGALASFVLYGVTHRHGWVVAAPYLRQPRGSRPLLRVTGRSPFSKAPGAAINRPAGIRGPSRFPIARGGMPGASRRQSN